MSVGEPLFAIRPDGVVHDTIDGETLVINLETGSYYTLAGAGATIWHALAGGATYPALVTTVAETLGVDRTVAAGPVAGLIAALFDNGLIGCPDGGVPPAPSDGAAAAGLPGLLLEAYDELQELLLVDPIHEVDDAGWPNRAAAPS